MWPEYFPEQCPPPNARRENVQVYRLVGNSPTTAEDFQPTIVEFPHREFTSHQICMACGVSVFRELSDALKIRASYKGLRQKKIAFGSISESDGLVLQTGKPTHITWWLQTSTPHLNFKECAENEIA